MTIALGLCMLLLAVAVALALARLTVGPTNLDRTVALDVTVACSLAALGVLTAWTREAWLVPVLLVLSLLGFVGSVAVARFAPTETRGGTR
ncbi:monovalent cation/H+ antiporter complex subunit F [Actinomycetota bacterium]